MKNLAVFCSGFGSNLQAIINSVKNGKLKANIALVVSDKVDAYALVRAKKANLPVLFADPNDFKSRELFDRFVVAELRKKKIDLVVLAGFMRIITPFFVRSYRGKIINIHPSLLPAFKGTSGIKDAFAYGVKITGVTVHFVSEELDAGPIILQESVIVKDDDTLDSLSARVHKLEHKLYPKAIELVLREKLTVKNRKVSTKK